MLLNTLSYPVLAQPESNGCQPHGASLLPTSCFYVYGLGEIRILATLRMRFLAYV